MLLRGFLLATLGVLLLGCEREAAVGRPDVTGRWVQEDAAGRVWVDLHPGGRAEAYASDPGTGAGEATTLQWYWVDDALMLRGGGGLSQRLAVDGDRMTMADGTALVRTP